MAEMNGFFRLQCLLSILLLSFNNLVCHALDEDRKVYIVYMGSLPTGTMGTYSPTSQHLSLLHEVVGETSAASASASASASLIRSFTRSFNGFVAKLSQKEADKLAMKKEVFSVFPRQTLHVQTTRSWDFLGLPKTAKRRPTVESNTIIGVMDSGADPTSESFNDKGFGPPPRKWKGSCVGGPDFTCNNKLIGARIYVFSEESAVDSIGHGTHTASTAAGSAVDGASFYGLANGTARGGVPSSRIAVYKVCDASGCQSDAILAGFDDAIADGVDIITVSLGPSSASRFDMDPIAIGAFHAMAKGVLVTHSAGNSGPTPKTVSSVAPWLLSVAASSIDRLFTSKLVLKDGNVLAGPTVNGFPSHGENYDLVLGKQVNMFCSEDLASKCLSACIDMRKVVGKIIICNNSDGVSISAAIYNATGFIMTADSPDVAAVHALPAVALEYPNFEKLVSYHSSARNPQGRILKSEIVRNRDSPTVSYYSSRGPNVITPDIMKPDISAPGTSILAAYPPKAPPTEETGEHRSVKFNVLTGTSMSCPHAAGAAAYVKTFHPDWSPSIIKSALMTTASKLRNGEATGYEYSYGSGQINPAKALDPGLVYEITKADYLQLLCSLGLNIKNIDSNSTCLRGAKNITGAELNYPSLSFQAPVSKSFKLALNRTVTNVGPANSTYKATASPSSISIRVVPEVLSFKSVSQKKSFTVEIAGRGLKPGAQLSEEIVWSDGVHSVRSPIIVSAA